jgi:hypothetical protein
MMGYIQEISRGGRDKQQTFCYLLPTGQWGSASSTELDAYVGVKEMAQMCFGTDKGCLRHMITNYNDGHGVSCGDDKKNFRCSSCLPTAGLMPSLFMRPASNNPLKRKAVPDRPDNFKKPKYIQYPQQQPPPLNFKMPKSIQYPQQQPPPPPPPPSAPLPMSASMKKTWDRIQKTKQDKFSADIEIMQALQKNLELMVGECAACFWMVKISDGHYLAGRHEFTACDFLKAVGGKEYCNFKNLINYDDRIHSKICFICHVPSFGEKLHGKFTGPNSCRYLDIILPTLFFGYVNMKDSLEKEFRLKWPTLMQFGVWLSGKLIKPTEKSNLVSAFMFICTKLL